MCKYVSPSCLAREARAAWNHPMFFEWGKLEMPVISNLLATSVKVVREKE
jgi:hypothetical protein